MSVAKDSIEWHPGLLIRDPLAVTKVDAPAFAIIVLNQPLDQSSLIRRLWQNACLHVAADGGANCLYEARSGEEPIFDNLDVIIGDLDSLRPDVRRHYESAVRPTRVIHDPDQYSTDFGKAVKYVRQQSVGPVDMVAVGGLGGRVDQGLSQLHHLCLFQQDSAYAEGRMYLVSAESLTFLLKPGRHRIHVREDNVSEDVFGKHVGVVPIKEPSLITLRGFEWDVTDWKTEFGGQMSTSNHVLPESNLVEVETTKDVLFTIALKGPD